MKHRKNQIIKSVAPSYSRKSDSIDEHSHSYLNISRNQKEEKLNQQQREAELGERLQIAEKEILKLRNRLAVEVSNNRLKDA